MVESILEGRGTLRPRLLSAFAGKLEVILQSGWSGCRTGNEKILSSSQAQLGQATYLAVAQFLSVSCVTSTPSTL